jgi:hypothetical protein
MEHNTEITSSGYLKLRGVEPHANGGVSARSNGSAGDVTRTLVSVSNAGDGTNRVYEQVYNNERPAPINQRRAALYDLPHSRRGEKNSSSMLMQSVLTNSQLKKYQAQQ